MIDPASFDPIPSDRLHVDVQVVGAPPADATVRSALVGTAGDVPAWVGADRGQLAAAGFTGAPGQTLVVPGAAGPVVVAGVGDPAALTAAALRDAAGALARAVASHARVAVQVPPAGDVGAAAAAQALVEGVLLARYRYDALKREPGGTPLESLAIVVEGDRGEAAAGAARGRAFARAGALARDFANTPPAHLTAVKMADVAVELAGRSGLGVEVFDKDALVAMGCGGLLGVNAGSVDPPRMVKLTYRPRSGDPRGHLTLVGKGIMYDSGGISLKPSDAVHATMKNDMSGAGAVMAMMAVLTDVDCPTAVTAYLMCTDNMPSGSAMKLGDVITMRGGTTVEVVNTDAEGRLIMADALVLATEEPTDAIVDIATLTGACLRALGTEIAGVMGNHQALVDQIASAAGAVDEPVWQFPLDRRYRKHLDSQVADMKNLGGEFAGTITAALFLAEFVGDVPWAHIDIAGTAQSDTDSSWRTAGCTGFGARLLLELATDFEAPRR